MTLYGGHASHLGLYINEVGWFSSKLGTMKLLYIWDLISFPFGIYLV